MCSFVRGRWLMSVALWCALVMGLAGCSVSLQLPEVDTSATAGACDSTTGAGCAVGSGATGLQLFIEPQAGVQPVVDVISSAKQSVWLEVYLLTDPNVMTALEDDAKRGLDVRVMLDPSPLGQSKASIQKTMNALEDAGVQTNEASPDYTFTHAKFMVIDASILFLMTANLTKAALNDTNGSVNREYLLNDTSAQDVQEAASIFTNDWNRTTPTLSDPNLVVSPVNSRVKILALINQAQSTLYIENEEMKDEEVEQALAAAAQRGVKVEVILPRPDSGDKDSNQDGIDYLRQNNVTVGEDKKLYIHAKLIIMDEKEAYVGSENFSATSLDKNRELGILIADAAIIQALETTFMSDEAVSA